MSKLQAQATLKLLKGSPQKVNLVAALMRGRNAQTVVSMLPFVRKRVAKPLCALLNSAIANAENNHAMDVESLIVREVRVGKALVMKRSMARAKGRGTMIRKPFTKVTVVLEEQETS